MDHRLKSEGYISKADLEKGEILNVNKPEGWTSFDVVNKLRKISRIKKVGHAGTLDPFATGVLLICFASATKRVSELMESEKEYVTTLELGKETDSHDVTGNVMATYSVPNISEVEMEKVLQRYRGKILQKPPMISAIKKGGQRLYKLARKGKSINLEPRKVTIHSLELLALNLPSMKIRLTCSRGTYVRAIARDIGKDLGCGAYLKTLERTRIGAYHVDQSLTVEEFIKRFMD